MNGYEACKTILSLKLHFTSSYDYFKYDGSVSLTPDGYLKRNDRYSCEKLARKYKTRQALADFIATVYAHSDNPKKLWTNSFITIDAEKLYDKIIGWSEGVGYHFKNELDYIFQTTIDNNQYINWSITVVDGEEPPILQMLRRNEISLECVALLNYHFSLTTTWSTLITDDLLYPLLATKIIKYTPFVVNRCNYDVWSKVIPEAVDNFPDK